VLLSIRSTGLNVLGFVYWIFNLYDSLMFKDNLSSLNIIQNKGHNLHSFVPFIPEVSLM
jgi:hypothetical protein